MKVSVSRHAAADTPRTNRGTRLTSAARRVQIIEVAISLFSRHGYNGTTTKALAAAAAISEATIFKHFKTKDSLYRAAFQHRTESGTAELIIELGRLADARDDRSLLRTLFDGVREGYTRDPDLHRMMQFALLEGEAAENARLTDELADSAVPNFVGSWIARRQEEGVFAPGPPLGPGNSRARTDRGVPSVEQALRRRLRARRCHGSRCARSLHPPRPETTRPAGRGQSPLATP